MANLNWREYKPHVLNQFPPMQDDEFNELKESLEKGFDETMPIIIYKGEGDTVPGIIDGANRHRACLETGTVPLFKEFYGSYDKAMAYILRTNVRRNLTAGQKAAVVLDMDHIVNRLVEEASKNQGVRNDLTSGPQGPNVGRTSSNLAQMAGVGANTMKFSQKVKQHDPQLYGYVKSGQISAKAAYNQIQDRIADGDKHLAMQRRAKSILKNAIQEAINESKDELYEAILDELNSLNEDQQLNFKLKITVI